MISVVIPVKDGGIGPRALSRGDRAPARRGARRGRRRGLGIRGRQRRARARAWAPGCTRSRRSEFHHGRHAEPRRLARRRRHARLHQPGRVRSGRLLARAPDRSARTRRVDRGRVRAPAPARERDPARALLPRLPLRAGARASSGSSSGDELTFEATLFSNVNSAMPRAMWEAFPFADDIVMSEDQEWSRRVLRAGLRRSSTSRTPPSTTRTCTRWWAPCGASSTRASRPSARTSTVRFEDRAPEGGRALRAGRVRMALDDRTAALDPVHRRLRAREVRRPPTRATSSCAADRGQVLDKWLPRALAHVGRRSSTRVRSHESSICPTSWNRRREPRLRPRARRGNSGADHRRPREVRG